LTVSFHQIAPPKKVPGSFSPNARSEKMNLVPSVWLAKILTGFICSLAGKLKTF
jgi:hypothetical protein